MDKLNIQFLAQFIPFCVSYHYPRHKGLKSFFFTRQSIKIFLTVVPSKKWELKLDLRVFFYANSCHPKLSDIFLRLRLASVIKLEYRRFSGLTTSKSLLFTSLLIFTSLLTFSQHVPGCFPLGLKTKQFVP